MHLLLLLHIFLTFNAVSCAPWRSANISSSVWNPRALCLQPDPGVGTAVDERICGATLALIKSDPKYEVVQQFGPNFGNITWNIPQESCHIILLARSPGAEANGSLSMVVESVEQIFQDCKTPGWGGTLQMGREPEGFWTTVYGVASNRADAVVDNTQTS